MQSATGEGPPREGPNDTRELELDLTGAVHAAARALYDDRRLWDAFAEDIKRNGRPRRPRLLAAQVAIEAALPHVERAVLTATAANNEMLEIARKAIEDALIDFRDSGILLLRSNGLVCRTRDGQDSSIIRLGPEDAMRIGLNAIAEHLAAAARPDAGGA